MHAFQSLWGRQSKSHEAYSSLKLALGQKTRKAAAKVDREKGRCYLFLQKQEKRRNCHVQLLCKQERPNSLLNRRPSWGATFSHKMHLNMEGWLPPYQNTTLSCRSFLSGQQFFSFRFIFISFFSKTAGPNIYLALTFSPAILFYSKGFFWFKKTGERENKKEREKKLSIHAQIVISNSRGKRGNSATFTYTHIHSYIYINIYYIVKSVEPRAKGPSFPPRARNWVSEVATLFLVCPCLLAPI